MPARKISPQSFDDILSELGNDPAIPDPHGIRKSNSPNSPKHPAWAEIDPHQKSKVRPNFQEQIPDLESLKKVGLFVGVGGLLVALAVALFLNFNPTSPIQNSSLDVFKQDIAELKKELALLREEMLDSEDSIYEAIELIEVSIHSLEKIKTQAAPKAKPPTIPFEPEVRRWRYLGVSQMGVSHRAFFHNGKTTLMIEIGGLLLGEWRLSNADKETATINHPRGKSLTLKAAISE